jgi:hypothetical protein
MLYRSVILCETSFITWFRQHSYFNRHIMRYKFNTRFGPSAFISTIYICFLAYHSTGRKVAVLIPDKVIGLLVDLILPAAL